MSATAAPLPAVHAALTGLIDYAGLFPPAQLDMAGAVAEYEAARNGRHAWMLGRFIVPLSQLSELRESSPKGAAAFRCSGIFPKADDNKGPDGGWFTPDDGCGSARIETFESLNEPEKIARIAERYREAHLGHYPRYIEWPRNEQWLSTLDATVALLREKDLGAKIRCGGLEASAFPSPSDVAAFLTSAARHGVAYKATAGLHHPFRHTDSKSGFVMHGFLNLLFAAVFAQHGASEEEVTQCLRSEDPAEFAFDQDGLRWKDRRATTAQVRQTRSQGFIAYGSCSFDEPVEDLRGLGLL